MYIMVVDVTFDKDISVIVDDRMLTSRLIGLGTLLCRLG